MSLANQIRKKLLVFTDVEIHKIQKRSEENKDFIFKNKKNKTASPIIVTYEETFSFNNVTDQTTVVISSNHKKTNSLCSFFEKCSYSISTADYSNNSFFVENKDSSPSKYGRKKTDCQNKDPFLRSKNRTFSLHEDDNLERCTENILNAISDKKKQNENSFKYLKNLCKSFKIIKKPIIKKKNNWHLIPVNKKIQEKNNKKNKRRSADKNCFRKK